MKLLRAFSDFIRMVFVLGAKGVCFLFSNALLVGKEMDWCFFSTEANNHSFRNFVA